jgi:integrase
MAGRARANGEGSIFPYRNGWAAYVWVTTPNGLRDRKWVYGQDREEVHGKWVKLQADARRKPIPTSVPTLGRYLAYWLDEVIEPTRAPLTYVTYETLARVHLVPGLGAKKLDRLSVRDVQTWFNRVAVTCQCCAQGKDARRPESKRRCCAVGKCCRSLPSARTLRDIRAVLRSALSQAMVEELVSRNVAALVKHRPIRKRSGRRLAWTSEEARRFLEYTRREEHYLYAAFVLILVLGLRKGEVLGLTWVDVDLDAGELAVRLQLQRVGTELLHRETKTEESAAPLPLPAICVNALRRQEARQEEARVEAGDTWHDFGLVFTTRYGTPVDPRNLSRAWDLCCAAAGVRKITVHDARRTCATLLVDLDVHPRVVMQILRHTQFAITMEIYTQVSSGQTRTALKRLGESLDGVEEGPA